MFFLTQNPSEGTTIVKGGGLVGSVYLGLLFYLGVGGLILWIAARSTVKLFRKSAT
jgi:hypothetical protein